MNNKLIEELYNRIDAQEKIIRELQEDRIKYKEENKHLQDQLNQALKDYDNELQKNNKAIEYVKSNNFYAMKLIKINEEKAQGILELDKLELLKILEGEE